MQITIVLAADFYEHSDISAKYAKFKQKEKFPKDINCQQILRLKAGFH